MAKKDYSALADAIIEKVGGKANISYLTHCVTRLRFNVKDRALANLDDLNNISGVLGDARLHQNKIQLRHDRPPLAKNVTLVIIPQSIVIIFPKLVKAYPHPTTSPCSLPPEAPKLF